MLRTDVVRLCFGKALIVGNKPVIVGLDKFNDVISKTPQLDVASFGLFETSAPNYTTYYPDVTAEDLSPKEEDFYYPVVRSLSQVIVHKNRNPIDFGIDDVLRKSQGLLKGQTVNADHEIALGNAMGAVKNVEWQDSYKTSNGLLIPGGINSELKLDGKSNPRIVRLMKMDPPGIHSVSVTVEFAWEKSHPDMPDNEFFTKLASLDDKGNMYKRNVTKVLRYHEISLVAHGADPYAQLVNDKGEINNPKYAHITYNSAEEKKIGMQYFFFDMATDIISNSTIPKDNNIITSTKTNMKEAILFLGTLAKSVGYTTPLAPDATEIPTEMLTALTAGTAKWKTDADTLAVEKEKITGLTTQVNNLTTELAEAKKGIPANVVELQTFHTTQLTALRNDVVKNYTLTTKTPAPEILTAINGADYNSLILLNAQYSQALEKSMPLTCKDCSSTNVSRASATAADVNENGDPAKPTHTIKNNADTLNNLKRKSKTASFMHGVVEEAKK